MAFAIPFAASAAVAAAAIPPNIKGSRAVVCPPGVSPITSDGITPSGYFGFKFTFICTYIDQLTDDGYSGALLCSEDGTWIDQPACPGATIGIYVSNTAGTVVTGISIPECIYLCRDNAQCLTLSYYKNDCVLINFNYTTLEDVYGIVYDNDGLLITGF
ncbi:hypothetical protein LOTGIDRAFT_170513 [Lottia gigantea]|uniref:Apple domain-containing protein n=1 Tax=Lottia gigantea TaxID=225164 RepID=V4CQD6_LOTGI|nr:hypothetical protein LOTGIDRAFT_170513 [Lottia gigantea]ESP04675.1 hypothetical protein LOTGIDRAFT_170513 [Lottia gigantea]